MHHLPDKYVKMLPDVYTEESTPNERWLAELQKDMKPGKPISRVMYNGKLMEYLKKRVLKLRMKMVKAA